MPGTEHGTPMATRSCGSISAPALEMTGTSRPFVVTRNKHIAPKERRIERLPSGYAVRELRDDSQGRYWYVVVALEVMSINGKRASS